MARFEKDLDQASVRFLGFSRFCDSARHPTCKYPPITSSSWHRRCARGGSRQWWLVYRNTNELEDLWVWIYNGSKSSSWQDKLVFKLVWLKLCDVLLLPVTHKSIQEDSNTWSAAYHVTLVHLGTHGQLDDEPGGVSQDEGGDEVPVDDVPQAADAPARRAEEE